ncbi:MAG: ATP-binding cassette domain-containing protein [Lachnospiraceae bacterium]|nr:ATP-binding cassette domain-containing protein [Lachnospiraceae bacterium]
MIMLLKAENIGMTYPKSDRVILKEQSLNIERNDLIVITGPSGRGKSTLLAIAGGILRPTSGHVYFEDKDLYSLSDKELSDIHRTKIGYVPQSNVMLKDYNILDNIVMPFVLGDKNTDVNALKQKALELMSKFKIEDLEKRYPFELSGGELKRVSLIRALLPEPDLIIADEPTTGIDPQTSDIILDQLKHYSSLLKAVLIATHDSKAEGYATFVIGL